jgi:4-hydroxy-tetrahydrodipicolinate synthase
MNLNIKGVIVPMLTPFDARGALDADATRRLVDYLIARGVKGLFPVGTTGEMPLLTVEERCRMAEMVVTAASGRIPVIIHTGSATTRQTIELTRHAQAIGANAAAMIPPYYYHYDDEAIFQHFAHVAEQTPDFSLYLYDNPAVTGNTITLDVIRRLVDRCPNIVGLKDSSGSLATLAASRQLRGGDFNTATGPDGLILAGAAMGIDACVSGNANVVPELVVALHAAATHGDLPRARELQATLDAVRAILRDGADLSLFKGVLAQRGLAVGTVRAPLMQAADTTITTCWQALTALNLELSPV